VLTDASLMGSSAVILMSSNKGTERSRIMEHTMSKFSKVQFNSGTIQLLKHYNSVQFRYNSVMTFNDLPGVFVHLSLFQCFPWIPRVENNTICKNLLRL
jgi:hypothetical protein